MNKERQNELEDIKNQLNNTSFTFLVDHLVNVEKWKLQHAMEACEQYRNFMFIKKKYGHEYDIPPSTDIDDVWNAHILFTKQYTDFTKNIFGEYLNHHVPHSTDKLEARKIIHDNFINITQPLYFKEFGTYLYKIRNYPIINELQRIIIKYFFKRKTNE